MRLTIRHDTVYHYGAPLARSIQLLRLTPRSTPRQRVLKWRLELPAGAPEHIDAYGNVTRLLAVSGPHREIRIGVEGLVETSDAGEPGADAEPDPVPPQIFLQETVLTAADARVQAFADEGREAVIADAVGGLVRLMERVRAAVHYVKGTTDVQTTAADVLAQGRGVCQDQSHLFIACCKALGVPARYVSGYCHAGDDAGEDVAMHAWAEAWVPTAGWQTFDLANGCPEGPAHLRLAVGRDYLGACPVRGIRYGGGEESLSVQVRVTAEQQQQQ